MELIPACLELTRLKREPLPRRNGAPSLFNQANPSINPHQANTFHNLVKSTSQQLAKYFLLLSLVKVILKSLIPMLKINLLCIYTHPFTPHL